MPIVELYTSPFCGYCIVAKRLLVDRNLNYVEVDLSNEPNRRSEMLLRSGGSHTVPQIFINNKHVGGCNELLALDLITIEPNATQIPNFPAFSATAAINGLAS